MRTVNYYAPRVILVFAAVWAVGVSLYILFSPITVLETTAQPVSGEAPIMETTTRSVRWYQVQGWWGMIVLFIFALLYGGTAFFTWRDWHGLAVAGGVLALFLTYLAGFSIGGFYMPAAVVVLAAAV